MAKSQKNQTFVLKINTGYLSRHNWSLTLKLSEIRKQSQLVVSLGSSQVLRWMEKKGNDETATRLKKENEEKGKKKIWSYFIKNYNPESVLSYCDFAKFNGISYNQLGFTKNKITQRYIEKFSK